MAQSLYRNHFMPFGREWRRRMSAVRALPQEDPRGCIGPDLIRPGLLCRACGQPR